MMSMEEQEMITIPKFLYEWMRRDLAEYKRRYGDLYIDFEETVCGTDL